MNAIKNKMTFNGDVKEIVILFLPIALMTFSASLMLLVERLFFARLSTVAMEAAVNVAYVFRIFQSPCISLAMMAQVYVGRLYGAGDQKNIGKNIWQFIWFSLFSMIITLPLSLLYGQHYFGSTVLGHLALPYFYCLMSINFLYPLGACLSCFLLGRGKTRLILFATLGSQLTNILLVYCLVFGLGEWLPPLGLIGGALGTLVAQGGYCLFLGAHFLSKKNASLFGTWNWHLNPKLFWECIYPGFLRALNRISVFACWAAMAHMMINKESNYLLIWSIGSAIGLFLPFIGEALGQALTTVLSNMLGARDMHLIAVADKSAHLIAFAIIGIFTIPMLIFPETFFHMLFPDVVLASASIKKIFFGLWLAFVFWNLTIIPISHISAFKDTKFLLFTGVTSWINVFSLMYIALNIFKIPADDFWIVLSLSNFTDYIIFYWRANRLKSSIQVAADLT